MPTYHATKTGKLILCNITSCRTKYRVHVLAPENFTTVKQFLKYSELNLPEPLPFLPRNNQPVEGEEKLVLVTTEIKEIILNIFDRKRTENFFKFISERNNVTLTYTVSDDGFKNISFIAPLVETTKFLNFLTSLVEL